VLSRAAWQVIRRAGARELTACRRGARTRPAAGLARRPCTRPETEAIWGARETATIVLLLAGVTRGRRWRWARLVHSPPLDIARCGAGRPLNSASKLGQAICECAGWRL
jgi:hypothetical protein